MKKSLIILFLIFLSIGSGFTQPLDSILICIDPGHGGHEGDDRFISTTGFWESESNFGKALYLRTILEDLGATIILTREGNDDNILDDPSLSQRVEIANSNFVDYMHSIHSNGFEGQTNYTLMLFQGFDNGPTYPEAKEMSEIMGPEVFNAHRTTTYYVRGDFDFYGTGGPYLGIFRNLNMPGTLSEGSFHDYIPESWRLMNSMYHKHEAWAIARSFLEYFEAGTLSYGEIAGVVRDTQKFVNYFYLSSTDDARTPVNNLTVTLQPGNLVYSGDDMNNGFFLFDSLVPGPYTLYFDAPGYHRDSTEVTVTANQTVFADADLLSFSPSIPEHVRVLQDGPTSLKIGVEPALHANGYRVYIGQDGVSFTDSVDADTTAIIVPDLQENRVYYFKVSALNDSLVSDKTRRLYAGVPSSESHEVLIVNGFDRGTNNRFDYIRFCANPINDRGYPFSYVMNETVILGEVLLTDYSTVIWILGDESTVDETFSNTEQIKVKAFLDGGGHLFVSGPEIGWDLDNKGSSSDKQFYNNYLKAKYVTDAPKGVQSGYYTAIPIMRGIFEGLENITFDDGTHGTIDSDWPDAIWAQGGAGNILQYQNVTPTEANGVAAIAYEGLFPNGTVPGKMVYLAFPFETVYDATRRTEIMDRVFDFFEGEIPVLPIDQDDVAKVKKFSLEQNFPNPFNPLTKINFSLNETNQTTLIIYDVIGRKIKTLLDRKMVAGEYGVDFNASHLASGTYFYVLRSGPFIMRKKMVLIK
jgi:N-acetylmuramoyl-L-alanine amidase